MESLVFRFIFLAKKFLLHLKALCWKSELIFLEKKSFGIFSDVEVRLIHSDDPPDDSKPNFTMSYF